MIRDYGMPIISAINPFIIGRMLPAGGAASRPAATH
jgi:hypothetical protein